MTYKAYIKKDYKPEIRWIPDQPWYLRKARMVGAFIAAILVLSAYSLYPGLESKPVDTLSTHEASLAATKLPDPNNNAPKSIYLSTNEAKVPIENTDVAGQAPIAWQTVDVKQGDNL